MYTVHGRLKHDFRGVSVKRGQGCVVVERAASM
jgi:hypothetical protein